MPSTAAGSKHDFLQLAVTHGVLRFGEFKLKSGRISPYFFNLGLISTGAALQALGRAYARALVDSAIEFDMLFGPAYKGIPLAAAVAIALAEQGRDLPWAYNRKEAKDHGEGGLMVGAPPEGRVVIVDDVLTAGTALRESVAQLRAAGAHPIAALIALDRQETGPNGLSTVAELEREQELRVISLVNLDDVLGFLAAGQSDLKTLDRMREYRARYGVPA